MIEFMFKIRPMFGCKNSSLGFQKDEQVDENACGIEMNRN